MAESALLGKVIFTAPEAARHLRIPVSTLIRWLDGETRQGRRYEPVIRIESTGAGVTWGEFVEANYLRAYRNHGVALQRLRPFVTKLRTEFGVPYPLAHFTPFIDEGKRLVLRLQQLTNVPDDLAIFVESASGQLTLTPSADTFLRQVEFAVGDTRQAERIRPDGPDSPVVLDPEYSSGAPTVQGIRTEALAELIDAGEPLDAVAADYGLRIDILRRAVAYEWRAAA